jgi:tetratricopeptide (TPR) repeat protein
MLSSVRVFLSVVLVLAVAGCQTGAPTPSVNRIGFKANYLVARAALEKGQYTKAERSYASLLKTAGPLESRLRLEYAHTLLRSGKFEKASDEARVVASQLDGRGRAAALAVQATADQEIARNAINKGTVTTDAVQRLVAAKQAFDEVLAGYPDLDPLGGLALRRKTIDIEMSTIR